MESWDRSSKSAGGFETPALNQGVLELISWLFGVVLR